MTCLLKFVHSIIWPDECAIVTEEGQEVMEGQLESHKSQEQKVPPKQLTWLLDFFSIDPEAILPFVVEKFSSKDVNVTLIYNLINIFFARLKIDSNTDEGIVS